MRFQDKAVLVAGGTGALGRAVCLAFLAEGARVTASGRERAAFDPLREAAGPLGARLDFVAADAADPEQARAAVEAAGRGGKLAAVVSAVGTWAGGASLAEEPPDRLGRMLAANLVPAHALLRAAVPALAASGGGAIVLVASAGAVGPQPGQASYGAAKAAVLSLVVSVAEEARAAGVRVNAVLPGTMDTEANRLAMPSVDRSAWVGTGEVARAIVFLCSDDAAAVTGAALPVRRG
jgi:NAD(P)-dependent dehydrogenase (short-subunit alcohol dehydrogenase family)